jgi:hypothetical protein
MFTGASPGSDSSPPPMSEMGQILLQKTVATNRAVANGGRDLAAGPENTNTDAGT